MWGENAFATRSTNSLVSRRKRVVSVRCRAYRRDNFGNFTRPFPIHTAPTALVLLSLKHLQTTGLEFMTERAQNAAYQAI